LQRERVLSGQMGANVTSFHDLELPDDLLEHRYIRAQRSGFDHMRSTVDHDALLNDLYEIISDNNSAPAASLKILVDLRYLEQITVKGYKALTTALGLVTDGEIALTGVSNRIKIQLEDLRMVKTETNPQGFRIVDLTASGGAAKEK